MIFHSSQLKVYLKFTYFTFIFNSIDVSNVTTNADVIVTEEEIHCSIATSSSPPYKILSIPTPTCKGHHSNLAIFFICYIFIVDSLEFTMDEPR